MVSSTSPSWPLALVISSPNEGGGEVWAVRARRQATDGRLWWSNSFLKRWWSLLPCSAWCLAQPLQSWLLKLQWSVPGQIMNDWCSCRWARSPELIVLSRSNSTFSISDVARKKTIASVASSFNLETSPTRSPGRPVANPWEWLQLPQQGAPIFFNRKSCHTLALWLRDWKWDPKAINH